jgi:hypothetical protein
MNAGRAEVTTSGRVGHRDVGNDGVQAVIRVLQDGVWLRRIGTPPILGPLGRHWVAADGSRGGIPATWRLSVGRVMGVEVRSWIP